MVPLCCICLLRYIFRVKNGNEGDPTESLLNVTWGRVLGRDCQLDELWVISVFIDTRCSIVVAIG